jgi:hypothetical protein
MQITTIIEANASAADSWHVLGEQFGDISWAKPVLKSSLDGPLGEGAVRTCDIKAIGPIPAGQVTEEITHFDRDDHSLTYVLSSGLPAPMKYSDNVWTIEDLGSGRSKVTSVGTFKFKWWALWMSLLMRIPMKRAVRGLMNEFKGQVEARSQTQSNQPLRGGLRCG